MSDRTIAAAAAAGHTSVEEIAIACGAGGDCGTCHLAIEEIVAETVTAVSLQPAAA